MTIEIMDSLTLDDNHEYVVVSKVNYENKTYYSLLDKLDSSNIIFCYEENDELVESIDKDINTKLISLFYNEGKEDLDKFVN